MSTKEEAEKALEAMPPPVKEHYGSYLEDYIDHRELEAQKAVVRAYITHLEAKAKRAFAAGRSCRAVLPMGLEWEHERYEDWEKAEGGK